MSAVLGWDDAGSYYTWNRTSEEIELRNIDDRVLPTRTGSRFHGDPANATRAGSMLIGALRAVGGRRIEAISIGEATPRWTRPPGILEFVRCAGDVAAPCVAGVALPTGATELRRIDPATGTLGERVVVEARSPTPRSIATVVRSRGSMASRSMSAPSTPSATHPRRSRR